VRAAVALVACALLATSLARAAGSPPALPCTDRYVVIRAHGPFLHAPAGSAVDTIVLGNTTVTIGNACAPSGALAKRTRHGWRLTLARVACGAAQVRVRARLTRDCSLMRGTLNGRGRAHGTFTATTSRCGDGITDSAAGEQCDDGNLESGDGCEPYCLSCDASAPPFASTWAGIEVNLFARYRCTGCHSGAAVGGLDLRANVAYRDLVGVPSLAEPGVVRLAPGDAQASLLWLLLAKGTGAQGYDEVQGIGMPFGGRITADELEALRQWIDAGAPDTGVVVGSEVLVAPCPH
jgi:cysteine-rich repeat protein